MLCNNCGKELSNQAIICPDCGVGTSRYKENHVKRPRDISVVLNIFSLLFPTVGIMYYFLDEERYSERRETVFISSIIGIVLRAILFIMIIIDFIKLQNGLGEVVDMIIEFV